jgi:peptidoglycan/xylan/chitin deacetylase (PgdA/CDA1 family)
MDIVQKINSRITRAAVLKPMPSRLKAPVASITFDDFPRSALTEGGRLLKERGVRGTYYVAGAMRDAQENGRECFRTGDLEILAAEGHEIGCHTFTHPHLAMHTKAFWDEEMASNRAFLEEELPGRTYSTFAYPYGETSLRAKLYFGARFAACRGIERGVNHDVLDLSQLKAVGIEARSWREDVVRAAVDAAVARNGWVIFYTHDISDDPTPYGARPGMLAFVLDRLAEARIEILPVKHALARAVVF